jgi:hypothetical protein
MAIRPLLLMAALLAVAALLLFAGCGKGGEGQLRATDEPQAEWMTYRDTSWGYSVSFPSSWQRAREPVAPSLTEPREILSLATFPLRQQPSDCEAFGGAARSDLGARDVFLTVLERGYDHRSEWPDFPPRPEHFGPSRDAAASDHLCGDTPGTRTHWRNFSDQGRHFHTLVAIGPEATPQTREDAWLILDSLRLDPDRQPSWPASG